MPGARRQIRKSDFRTIGAARHVDGLGSLLLHVRRFQYHGHLGVFERVPEARVAVPERSADAVVLAMRHEPFRARDGGLAQGPGAPLGLRDGVAEIESVAEAAAVDDYALDAG